jgi:hypothetical protein
MLVIAVILCIYDYKELMRKPAVLNKSDVVERKAASDLFAL